MKASCLPFRVLSHLTIASMLGLLVRSQALSKYYCSTSHLPTGALVRNGWLFCHSIDEYRGIRLARSGLNNAQGIRAKNAFLAPWHSILIVVAPTRNRLTRNSSERITQLRQNCIWTSPEILAANPPPSADRGALFRLKARPLYLKRTPLEFWRRYRFSALSPLSAWFPYLNLGNKNASQPYAKGAVAIWRGYGT